MTYVHLLMGGVTLLAVALAAIFNTQTRNHHERIQYSHPPRYSAHSGVPLFDRPETTSSNSSPRPKLSLKHVDSITITELKSVKEQCPVCLDDISESVKKTLSCGHQFHHKCFQELEKRHITVCPTCYESLL